jgi:hypothetical protein
MAQDMQTAIAEASKAAEASAGVWQPPARRPQAPGVFRTRFGPFRRWDGKTWHKGARDYDLAAKTEHPLDKEQWIEWAPVRSDYAKGSRPANGGGNGNGSALVQQGKRLVLLGRALQDPDISVRKLMQMSEEAGFPLDLTFKSARGE